MAQKTVGYVELEWNCPNCGKTNTGMTKSCSACGAPQPQNVQFELGQKKELITNAQKAADAARGADIICPFCDTRNTAGAQTCKQCGGDLIEGIRRDSGRVIAGGVPQAPAPNVPAAARSSVFRPWMAIPILGLLAMCCLVIGFVFFRTTDLLGVVQTVSWQRSIAIEAQRDVTSENWQDQLPANAKVLSCQQKYRRRQDSPIQGSREVCSTQLVDQGNGAAKVVESCYYEVYDNYCKYQALEWQQVDQALAHGIDLNPVWPQVNLLNGQRQGERIETYKVDFQTKDGPKQFSTSDSALFAQLEPGTQWTLSVNTLGAIVKVSP